jgi:phosphatidylglycerol:prolipoprotein diacylglycerol transferase
MCPQIRLLGLTLDAYVLLYGLAVVAAAAVALSGFRREIGPGRTALPVLAVAVAAGFVGAKLYYVAMARDDLDLASAETYCGFAGSAWYGGLLLSAVVVALLLRAAGRPVLRALDAMIVGLPVGQILGRVGCLLAGCCRGTPTDLPWAVSYPSGWPRRAHPSQLYEAAACAGIVIALWALRSRPGRDGTRFGLYLALAGLSRWLIELVRLNPKVFLSLTAPQVGATLEMALGLFLVSRPSRPRDRPGVAGRSKRT